MSNPNGTKRTASEREARDAVLEMNRRRARNSLEAYWAGSITASVAADRAVGNARRVVAGDDEGWSGGNCRRCGNYAARLLWCVCPRCRRTREGRELAEAIRKASNDGGNR